ncbi:hypothetical protein GJAV_G00099110 [Gymnothorax javanicus]|nr:hypothetical protein GJAV_G00099110 [Gymnothorax javanicus]
MDFHNLAFLSVLLLSALGCCTGQDLTIDLSDKNAFAGENVSFITNLDTQEFFTISWKFDSDVSIITSIPSTKVVRVDPAYENRAVFNESNGSLTLKDVTTSDTGSYVLSLVYPDAKETSKGVQLTVFEPTSDVDIKANVTDAVEFNDTVAITCSATGTQLVYSWLSDGKPFTPSDRIQLSGEDGSVLIITDILRSDKGPFTCTVSNAMSEKTSGPLSFNISYGPENAVMTAVPQMQVYSIGSNISLSCSAESSPPAVFDWLYNGESLNKPGPELTLEDIKVDQGGNYSCLASNPNTKRFSSSNIAQIALLERISGAEVTGPTAVLLAGNSSANISCQAASGTITDTEWLKDGKSLFPSDRVTFSDDKSSVDISPVQKTDTGVYKCTLKNAVGTDSASYKMTVNYGPEAVMIQGENEIEVNTPLKLTCSAASEPAAAYYWIFNGTRKDVKTAIYSREKAAYADIGCKRGRWWTVRRSHCRDCDWCPGWPGAHCRHCALFDKEKESHGIAILAWENRN